MFQESPFAGVCEYATLEVALMLVGTLLLGLLLGYLIWGWTRRKLQEAEKHIGSLTEANAGMKQRLDEFAIADLEYKSELARLQSTVASHASLILSLKSQLKEEQSRTAEQARLFEEFRSSLVASAASGTSATDVLNPEIPATVDVSDSFPPQISNTPPESDVAIPDQQILAIASEIFRKQIIVNDLTVIEGIGPKIAELLNNSGITSWKQLSLTTRHILRVILDEGGSQFRSHVPKTWPRQASMAANGEWKMLKAYQDVLTGGR